MIRAPRPDMMLSPYTAADVARLLGLSRDTFYRRRARLHAAEGLPRPISECGHPKWDRASIDAWRTRHHPARTKAAANDAETPLAPRAAEDWSRFLGAHYGVKT